MQIQHIKINELTVMQGQHQFQESFYSNRSHNQNYTYPVNRYPQQYSVSNWNTINNTEQLTYLNQSGLANNVAKTMHNQYGLNEIYSNAEPFRNDLDKKFTLIEYENIGDNQVSRQVRLLKNSTIMPPQKQEENSCRYFNVCCIIILVIVIIGAALTIYIIKTNQTSAIYSLFHIQHKVSLNQIDHHHLSFRS